MTRRAETSKSAAVEGASSTEVVLVSVRVGEEVVGEGSAFCLLRVVEGSVLLGRVFGKAVFY